MSNFEKTCQLTDNKVLEDIIAYKLVNITPMIFSLSLLFCVLGPILISADYRPDELDAFITPATWHGATIVEASTKPASRLVRFLRAVMPTPKNDMVRLSSASF